MAECDNTSIMRFPSLWCGEILFPTCDCHLFSLGGCICEAEFMGVDCTVPIDTKPEQDEVDEDVLCDIASPGPSCNFVTLDGTFEDVEMKCLMTRLRVSVSQ